MAGRALWAAALIVAAASPVLAQQKADSTAQAHHVSPRGALLRSAVLPGWGQLANHRPVRAALFAAATSGLVALAVDAQRELADLDDRLVEVRRDDPGSYQIDLLAAEHQDQAARRNTRVLFVAMAATTAALEAYVDAHLATFDEYTEVSLRPAPGGAVLSICARW